MSVNIFYVLFQQIFYLFLLVCRFFLSSKHYSLSIMYVAHIFSQFVTRHFLCLGESFDKLMLSYLSLFLHVLWFYFYDFMIYDFHDFDEFRIIPTQKLHTYF